ncbi:hypothetical protein Pgy4_30075 [Pseudomonas savastanoi pv. glycinea str. race 4]|uniref:Uncharacterized protein n=1 Tax=Pseudomonas savastanoi pv. glycinea str. race 4 TaxID=875330 RepID=F3CD88_PSESG|nr:hypothetical protein Pgy4_30075 [Pseudomonas savastanoi pv. glycinea str. race 4]
MLVAEQSQFPEEEHLAFETIAAITMVVIEVAEKAVGLPLT